MCLLQQRNLHNKLAYTKMKHVCRQNIHDDNDEEVKQGDDDVMNHADANNDNEYTNTKANSLQGQLEF